MKKINILVIFVDHLSTLYSDKTGRISWLDVCFFYTVPTFLAVCYFFFPFKLPDGIEGALIAVFSVFGALLFSAQIALYGLSPKSPKSSEDDTTQALEDKRYRNERKFFSDVNFNVSYLILLSCLSLVVFLGLLVMNAAPNIEGAFIVGIVLHFFLTLIMLIKRTHIAFASKYVD